MNAFGKRLVCLALASVISLASGCIAVGNNTHNDHVQLATVSKAGEPASRYNRCSNCLSSRNGPPSETSGAETGRDDDRACRCGAARSSFLILR